MARLPRCFAPHLPLHIIQRGNNRTRIFADDTDVRTFRSFLHEAIAEHELAVHAYVLMPNHFHLLATPASPFSAARTLQSLGRRYVCHFNVRHGRTGTLWEGRYRASPVDSDRYLLTCQRYIELNPVRAGMVAGPADFRWSSHRANAYGIRDVIVAPHALYAQLGRDDESRTQRYRLLFADSIPDPALERIRAATQFGWAIGDDDFRVRVETQCDRRLAPMRRGRKPAAGRPFGAAVVELVSDPNF